MSAGDVVQPIVSEITKPVVKLIGQELDYLLRPTKYVNKMSHQLQGLQNGHRILEAAVVEAKGLGKPIKPEVEQWLEPAGEVIAQAEELLRDSDTKRCFHGRCVDFGSRYKINKRAVEISEQRIPALTPAPESTSVARLPPPPTVLSHPDFMEFESTKATMQQIMEALKDAECGVIGIFGMGGIGKTTIVKKIAEMVKQDKQFDQVAMAVVSQSLDLKKIQGEIASMLDLEFTQEAGVLGRANQLHQTLMNLKRVLVILDDLWAWVDLAKIGIPDFAQHNGCKVMITSRSEDVCFSMGSRNEKNIKVVLLSEQESWELFKRSAGASIGAYPNLKEVAVDVMKECQGLPIALRTVGRALRGKDIGQWRSAKLQLKTSTTRQIEGLSKEVISCLRLSFDYLESDEMKACFRLCCLFPEDYDIPIEIIVRYAIGKRLFGEADTIDEARTLTETTLEKLKACCLLLEGCNKWRFEGDCVNVHDVVRDVGLSIASDEFKILSRSGPGLERWLQSNSSIEHVKGACFETKAAASLPEGLQCPDLEELILVGSQVDYSDAFFETMTRLKVLIHCGKSRLPTSLRCSISLRTLYLYQCELGDISAALGELKNLETLTINKTDIKSLPVEVGKLTNLRLLDLLSNYHLNSIPGNVISQLRQLEELHIGSTSLNDWEMEGTSSGTGGDEERGGRASLSELQSLSFLAILSIQVREFAQVPPNFRLPNKLVKFEISVGTFFICISYGYPRSRALKMGAAEFQLEGVKTLLHLFDGNDGGSRDSCKYYELGAAVEDVNGSKYVLTELAGGGGLNGLDRLEIRDNSWISSLTSCDNKAVPILFGNLQALILIDLGSLTGLGSGTLPAGSLQHLKFLEICRCHALEGWAVPWSSTQRLHLLQVVMVTECENVTGLFEVKAENNTNNSTLPVLSKLRDIHLQGLPRLRSLKIGEASSSLRVVRIIDCNTLVSVFTPNVVSQSLMHLERLEISDCRNLKVIFEETTRSIALPNLKVVTIDECQQLKSLFIVSMAKNLLKLEKLELYDNSELEEIISCDENKALGGAVAEEEEKKKDNAQSSSSTTIINWPQITTIRLEGSRQLKRFFPENSCIEIPQLRYFDHQDFILVG